MKFAYADPPYIGQAKVHYSHDARCAEVDHKKLIQETLAQYDGWALSCHTRSLTELLPLCPKGVRVLAWVKPFASFKKGVNPTYAWEPVIMHRQKGLRPLSKRPFMHDWVSCCPQFRSLVVGQKPAEFCFWLFECLDIRPGDEFADLFPGSGSVGDFFNLWITRKKVLETVE